MGTTERPPPRPFTPWLVCRAWLSGERRCPPRPGAWLPGNRPAQPEAPVTFLGSLGSFLAAVPVLFPSGAGVGDGGCSAPRLAAPQAGGAPESGGILGEPWPRQRGNRLTWGTAQEPRTSQRGRRARARARRGKEAGRGQPWLLGPVSQPTKQAAYQGAPGARRPALAGGTDSVPRASTLVSGAWAF